MGQAPPRLRVVEADPPDQPADPPPEDHPEFSEIGRSDRFRPLWWLPVLLLVLLIVAAIVIVT